MANKMRVLYADEDISLRTRVASYLNEKTSIDTIHLAQSASQLLQKIQLQSYDIIITDLQLSEAKDLVLFEHIRQIDPEVMLIVTTEMAYDALVRRLFENAIDYFLLKPFNIDSLYAQLISMFSEKQSSKPALPQVEISSQEKISQFLKSIEITENSAGFEALLIAVQLIQEDRSLINSVTNQLYPRVAEICACNQNKVERSIRQSIEQSWRSGALQNLNPRYTPNSMHKQDKPSNAEFIALIADRLLLESLSE